jgi:predicted O-methyltransferase YrrM
MNFGSQSVDWVLLGLVVVLGIALRVTSRNWARYRRLRREEGRGKPWVLPRVPVEELDPVFRASNPKLGHTPATEVAFISIGRMPVTGATSDYESWILAVLARNATKMFEFGTCTGRTAYLWARNSPPNARVYTLTLDPGHPEEYRGAASDDPRDEADALQETVFRNFAYTGTAVEHKVVQLYGDSKAFDDNPYEASCDLIFVDGSHARSYVESDSAKALAMVKPGGLILWHDYRSPHRSGGVYHALNALSERFPLVQIEGTSLVAYRRPRREGAAVETQAASQVALHWSRIAVELPKPAAVIHSPSPPSLRLRSSSSRIILIHSESLRRSVRVVLPVLRATPESFA